MGKIEVDEAELASLKAERDQLAFQAAVQNEAGKGARINQIVPILQAEGKVQVVAGRRGGKMILVGEKPLSEALRDLRANSPHLWDTGERSRDVAVYDSTPEGKIAKGLAARERERRARGEW